MILRRLLSFFLLIAFVARDARALDLGFAKADGGQAGAFLDFAASARSLGMGRAHAGVADDAGATYWNPAGLAQIERKDVVTLYSVLQEKTNFGFASFAQPTADLGTFGLGIVSLRSDSFEKRDATGDRVGSFSDSQLGLLVSNGYRLNDRLSLGGTVKVVRHEIDTFSGTGYGLDMAAMYKMSPRVQAGLVLRNVLAPSVKLRNTADEYARDAKLGFKFQPKERWLIASDLTKTQGRAIKLNLGSEFMVSQVLALRAGINENEVSAGLGFRMKDWGLDYAFGYHDAVRGFSDLGSSHRLGFHLQFGKRMSELAASDRWQKRGQEYLSFLRSRMNGSDHSINDEFRRHISGTKQVIRHGGFITPNDLYMAQGYVYFFEGELSKSVQSLSEATALAPKDLELASHLEMVRAQLSEEQTNTMIDESMARCKDGYVKGEFKSAKLACEQVLSLKADHVEAAAYLEDTNKRIKEPIERQLKIGRAKFEQGEYLDAIKHLQVVRELDPENQEAAEKIAKSLATLERQASENVAGKAVGGVYEISHDAEKSRSFYSQGLLLYSQGKVKEAANAWGLAVRYDNSNNLARNAYTRVIAELKVNP